MVLLTSSVLNPLILVLILSASGQNWCFWLFTVGLLFLFFFPVKLFFPDTHIWITSSERSLLASTPAPTHHALHICMHQGLVLDYRMSSPWVIQLTPFGTVNNYVYTSNSQLSPVPNLLWVPHLHKTNHKWKYDVLLVILSFNPHHNAKIPSDHLLFIFLLWMRSLFPTEDIVFPESCSSSNNVCHQQSCKLEAFLCSPLCHLLP